MALLNFSTPYLQNPLNPPSSSSSSTSNYYHQQQFPLYQSNPPLPHIPPNQGYSYPHPDKPFLSEEYQGGNNNNNNNNPYNNHPQRNYDNNNNNINKGRKTVIDYDYNDDDDRNNEDKHVPVTPIQGPIYIKNGTVPVVPLYSYPVLSNGTFVQIPILWTALSVALGLELRGEYIRGVPCLIRNQQLFCPTAGNSYPIDRIELFIDENKALMKRMYGEFDMPDYAGKSGPGTKRKRSTVKPGVPDLHFKPGPDPIQTADKDFNKNRQPRQNFRNNQSSESGRIDSCESKIEIVTPYWASNSAGKIRAIVNTQHFEQAIHQEVCARSSTKRCSNDCGCEQKYKWHRLLAYDPDNDCKGIFMDWFLFPSCCVCRCNP